MIGGRGATLLHQTVRTERGSRSLSYQSWVFDHRTQGLIHELFRLEIESVLVVDVLHVPPEIAALGECLLAPWALEGPLASVLPEVVTEVAALLENAAAPFELAFEVQFESLSLLVLHLDGLMPVVWNARESL